MTVAEYMDPNRFPRTTQPGLSPEQQMLKDSVNYDQLNEDLAGGTSLTPDEAEIARELHAKHTARAEVLAELKRTARPPRG